MTRRSARGRPAGPVRTKPAPYSAHSMIYACCTPAAQMEQAFAAARAAGAGYIRLDVNLRGIFTVRKGEPRRSDWDGVDRVAVLARAYRLPVLAVLTHVPDHIAKCNADHANSCPAEDNESYGRYAGLIAKRLEGVATYFEIGNEPDGGWAFRGSPAEYAHMLDAAYRHIRASVPGSRIVLGGLMYQNTAWVSQMLATPGVSAIRKFAVANVHLRGRAKHMPIFVKRWRRYFADRGFRGQLWVTEHGYPGNRLFQYDPAFRGGEAAQAAYLSRSLPALRKAGASQVFVTLRDSWPTRVPGRVRLRGRDQPGPARALLGAAQARLRQDRRPHPPLAQGSVPDRAAPQAPARGTPREQGGQAGKVTPPSQARPALREAPEAPRRVLRRARRPAHAARTAHDSQKCGMCRTG